jgi:hypothetical protein
VRRWPVNKKRLEYCSTGESVLSILMRSGPNLFANADPFIFSDPGLKLWKRKRSVSLQNSFIFRDRISFM